MWLIISDVSVVICNAVAISCVHLCVCRKKGVAIVSVQYIVVVFIYLFLLSGQYLVEMVPKFC